MARRALYAVRSAAASALALVRSVACKAVRAVARAVAPVANAAAAGPGCMKQKGTGFRFEAAAAVGRPSVAEAAHQVNHALDATQPD